MKKVCIFDLDGTLTDTLDSLEYSVNESLKEMGLSAITRMQVRRYVGNGARKLMERAIEAAGGDSAARIEEGMEAYGRIFGANSMRNVVPYEGICETLEAMKAKGMKLAVLSNKPHAQTVNVVETVFGKGYFAHVQGQMDSIPKKPDPGAVYEIMKKLDATKEETMYVGDSEVDVATGLNAGVTCIGVDWGFRDREELIEAGAEHLISSATDLLQYI